MPQNPLLPLLPFGKLNKLRDSSQYTDWFKEPELEMAIYSPLLGCEKGVFEPFSSLRMEFSQHYYFNCWMHQSLHYYMCILRGTMGNFAEAYTFEFQFVFWLCFWETQFIYTPSDRHRVAQCPAFCHSCMKHLLLFISSTVDLCNQGLWICIMEKNMLLLSTKILSVAASKSSMNLWQNQGVAGNMN